MVEGRAQRRGERASIDAAVCVAAPVAAPVAIAVAIRVVVAVALAAAGCRRAPAQAPSASPAPAVVAAAPLPAPATRAAAPAPPLAPPIPVDDDAPPLDPDLDAPPTPAPAALLAPSPSTSVGSPQEGHLDDGVRLPVEGAHGLAPLPHTLRRDWLYGTQELVTLLLASAHAVAAATPAERSTPLRVGNMSRRGGGDIAPSRSHNSGRDVDVSFFHRDRDGLPVDLPHMVRYDDAGVAEAPARLSGEVFFDTPRNWVLVRHWLSDPSVVVQWIFVAAPLRNILLDYALRIGETEALRARAGRVLVQPTDSSPHADHFHVRIACPADDRPRCLDGPGRTALARAAQIEALLHLYHHGSPAEQRYARAILSLPQQGDDLVLPPSDEQDIDDPTHDPP